MIRECGWGRGAMWLGVIALGVCVGVLGVPREAPADTIVQPDGLLLPDVGFITNPAGTSVTFSTLSGTITLSELVIDSPTARVAPPGGFGTFTSFFDVFVEVDLPPLVGSPFADTVAPASVRYTHVYSGGPISQYVTEMLQLDIQGGSLPLGTMLRESPTLVSGGGTTMTDLGGGFYAADSFFDVFFEISLDGGQTWAPADGSLRVTTVTPEPATLSLLGIGALGLLARRRRKQGVRR